MIIYKIDFSPNRCPSYVLVHLKVSHNHGNLLYSKHICWRNWWVYIKEFHIILFYFRWESQWKHLTSFANPLHGYGSEFLPRRSYSEPLRQESPEGNCWVGSPMNLHFNIWPAELQSSKGALVKYFMNICYPLIGGWYGKSKWPEI